MLEQQDLALIKKVVQEVVEEDVLPHFVDVYDQFENIGRRFENIDRRFENIDRKFEAMDKRFDKIESTMVTKDFLEDRLADFRADLKQSGGRALRQVKHLATELHRNGVLSGEQVIQITSV